MTTDLSPLTQGADWFSTATDDSDVVVCTRLRLARNLADHEFRLAEDGESEDSDAPLSEPAIGTFHEAVDAVNTTVRSELMPDVFDTESLELDVSRLDDEARGLLVERRLVQSPYPQRLYVTSDESLSIAVGGQDHLRIAVTLPGTQAHAALVVGRTIDKKLEDHLNYAVSLDLGYLSSSITDVGTGLRVSTLMHLPALASLGRVEELQESIRETDFSLVPDEQFTADEGESAVFLLGNQRSIGLEEDALIAKLADHTRALVHYERQARKELVQSQGSTLADAAYRSLGVLSHARELSADETLSLLSALRLGIVGELLGGVAAETVTALFFLSRENHVRAVVHQSSETERGGEENTQQARAAIVRSALAG